MVPETFLSLPAKTQEEILQTAATNSGKRSIVLEKDIWICLALGVLVSMPDKFPMVFKGGTTLSKIYGVIARFSEDIDITIDHRALKPGVDPYADGLSNTRKQRISEELEELAKRYVRDVITPFLKENLAKAVRREVPIELAEGGETVRILYPAVVKREEKHYLREELLLEFGGKSRVEPNEEVRIEADIRQLTQGLEYPSAQVLVLSPHRTFWEKATLIHQSNNKGIPPDAERLSRHWYDLAALADHGIGQQAVGDLELLKDVVDTKCTMYRDSRADYPACLEGGLMLVPEGEARKYLESDFEGMKRSGMFYVDPPSFEDICGRLEKLQGEINKTTSTSREPSRN